MGPRAEACPDPWNVVVAGGGFAALEVVLALRALTGGATRISLVAPDPAFAYREARPEAQSIEVVHSGAELVAAGFVLTAKRLATRGGRVS